MPFSPEVQLISENNIPRENIFGGNVESYENITELEKKELWKDEGGSEFEGDVGNVKRYVIGIPTGIEAKIREQGFSVRPLNANRLLFLGDSEGTGKYATTHLGRAMIEYGGSAAIVDIAMGRELIPSETEIFKIVDRWKNEFAWVFTLTHSVLGMVSSVQEEKALAWGVIVIGSAYLFLRSRLFDEYYKRKNADTVRLTPNHLTTRFFKPKKHSRLGFEASNPHDHWVLVRDPKRVKVVGVIDNPEQGIEYLKGITKNS